MKKYTVPAILLILLSISSASVAQLRANFTVGRTTGCAPVITNFYNASTGRIASWHWRLGSGASDTSNLVNPGWIYASVGTYNVTLIVTDSSGSMDSMTISNCIRVTAQPVVRFAVSDTNFVCPPYTINFTNLSDTTICSATHTWYIDSALIHTRDASYTFTRPGVYSISLREVDSCGCAGYSTRTGLIHIDSFPVINYFVSDSNPCTHPVTICFNNRTTSGVRYMWNFGDGGTDSVFAPCHVYRDTGSYTDTLTAYSTGNCRSQLIKPNHINVGVVNVGFYTVPASICDSETARFFDTTTIATHHFWRFSSAPGDTSYDDNPYHLYPAPGVYMVTDSAWSDDGCVGVSTRPITMHRIPTVRLTGDNLYRCAPNDTVHFTPTIIADGPVTRYEWQFVDLASTLVDTMRVAAPTYIYTVSGMFVVRLNITDTFGCSSAGEMRDTVKITAPVSIITADSVRGCIPFTLHYSTHLLPVVPYITDSVTFGDHTTYLTTDTGTHIYMRSGIYNVTHYYHLPEGCRFNNVTTITAGNHPTFTPVSYPDSVCPRQPVPVASHCSTCDNTLWTCTGPEYNGYFFYNVDSLNYIFAEPGIKTVTFTAEDTGCVDTAMVNIFVKGPTRSISAQIVDCADPFTFRFTLYPPGTIISSCRFTVSGTSISVDSNNAVITFPGYGSYTIVMYDTIYETGCYNYGIYNLELRPFPPSFTARDTVLCIGQLAGFDFARGYTSDLFYGDGFNDHYFFPDNLAIYPNGMFSHVYTDTGHYSVTLMLRNSFGCRDTIVQHRYIRVEKPVGGLRALPEVGCAPLSVTFVDSTPYLTGIATAYTQLFWDRDDTAHYSLTMPTTHRYPEGIYYAVMYIIDSNNCDATDTIRINSFSPHVSFSAAYPEICNYGQELFFCPTPGVTYAWNFNDGSPIDTNQNPVHTYTANGIYSPRLIVTTIPGSRYPVACDDTLTRANYINVSDTSVHPNFTLSDTIAGCPPMISLATNTSRPVSGSYFKWKFGFDSTTINSYLTNATAVYNYPGRYIITLIDSSQNGCVDSSKQSVLIGGPRGILTLSQDTVCSPGTVWLHFVSLSSVPLDSSYNWFLPPYGVILTDTPGIVATYTSLGFYSPYVIVDSNRCHVAFYTSDTLKVVPRPTVTITGSLIICHDATTLQAHGGIAYSWLPAVDISCDTCANVIVNPGANTVFTVTGYNSYGCTDTQTAAIIVDSPRTIRIAGKSDICAGWCDTLTGTGITGYYEWYGSGLSCNVCDQTVVCPVVASVYTLITTDALGCHDTTQYNITVHYDPIVNYSPNPVTVCKDGYTEIVPTGAASYQWYPNVNISSDSSSHPIVHGVVNLVYTVKATSPYGCTTQMDIPVSVIEHYPTYVSPDTFICPGQSVQIRAFGGQSYHWLNQAGLNDPYSDRPFANPDSTTIFSVVITQNRCFSDTQQVQVTVEKTPVFTIQPDYTIMSGNTVRLNPEILIGERLSFVWTAENTLTCFNCKSPLATPIVTTTYTVTIATPHGCSAEGYTTVHLFCDRSQVFIPNTFTPNNDGLNDFFYVSAKGIREITKMSVYDRWGEKIFDREHVLPNEPTSGWDGTLRGSELTTGVYMYIIEVLCEQGEVYLYHGDISLMK